MTESGMLWLLISTNVCSAAIAYLVTLSYWRQLYVDKLKEVAAERRQDAALIRNARIIENVYGETLGLDVMERKGNT